MYAMKLFHPIKNVTGCTSTYIPPNTRQDQLYRVLMNKYFVAYVKGSTSIYM